MSGCQSASPLQETADLWVEAFANDGKIESREIDQTPIKLSESQLQSFIKLLEDGQIDAGELTSISPGGQAYYLYQLAELLGSRPRRERIQKLGEIISSETTTSAWTRTNVLSGLFSWNNVSELESALKELPKYGDDTKETLDKIFEVTKDENLDIQNLATEMLRRGDQSYHPPAVSPPLPAAREPRTQIVPHPNHPYYGVFVEEVTPQVIQELERTAGTNVDIVLRFVAFQNLHFPRAVADTIAQSGGTVAIKLEPWHFGQAKDDTYSLERIAHGEFDEALLQFAREVRDFGRPIFLTFAHEMNGNWYPWGQQKPATYIAAWRRVHGIVSSEASNVTWVWNPHANLEHIQDYYPGDEVVDMVGIDEYCSEDWGGPWRAPEQLFRTAVAELKTVGRDKPIVIWETGVDANTPADRSVRKPEWIRQLMDYLASDREIAAVILFQQNKEETGGPKNWAIDTPQSQAALRKAIARHQLFGGMEPDMVSVTPIPIQSDATVDTWNGAQVRQMGSGTFEFSASAAADPGFVISLGNVDVSIQQHFRFEIYGGYQQLGQWARVVAQVYSVTDSETSPSISLDPVPVFSQMGTFSIPLLGVTHVRKVQFLLVTDRGNIGVVISNPRFE